MLRWIIKDAAALVSLSLFAAALLAWAQILGSFHG